MRFYQVLSIFLVLLASQLSLALTCSDTFQVIDTALERHVKYSSINDELTARFATQIPETLDVNHVLFLQSDVDELKSPTLLNSLQLALQQRQIPEQMTRFQNLFRIRIAESKAELALVQNKRAAIEAIAQQEPFPTTQYTDFPRTREERQRRLLTLMASLYRSVTKNNSDPVAAFAIAVRDLRNILDDRSLEIESDSALFTAETLMSALDPHSSFTPKTSDKGDAGMGLQYQPDALGRRILKVSENGGAAKAGLRAGDVVTHIYSGQNWYDVRTLTTRRLFSMTRGQAGTQVRLKVRRGEQNFEVAVTRSVAALTGLDHKSELIPIRYKDSQVNIGYFQFLEFREGTARDLGEAIRQFQKRNAVGLILDLRGNGGGIVTEALKSAGFFVGKKPGLQQVSREQKISRSNTIAARGSKTWDMPLIVLVDELSASCSELLTAILRDYQKAVVVGGPRTFGKGLISDSGLPIGTIGSMNIIKNYYYSPSGATPQFYGLRPDIVIRDFDPSSEVSSAKSMSFPAPPPPARGQMSLDPLLAKIRDTLQVRSQARLAQNPIPPTRVELSTPRTDDREIKEAISILTDWFDLILGS